jgi:hypothetical protein
MFTRQDIQDEANRTMAVVLSGLVHKNYLTKEQSQEIGDNYACFVVSKVGFMHCFWRKIWDRLTGGPEPKDQEIPFEVIMAEQVSHRNDIEDNPQTEN